MLILKYVFYYKPSSSSLLPCSSRMETIHLKVSCFGRSFYLLLHFSADITMFDVAHFFQGTYSLQNYLHSSCLKASQPQNTCCSHFRVPLRFLGVHMWGFGRHWRTNSTWLLEQPVSRITQVSIYKSEGAATRVKGACEWLGLDLGAILWAQRSFSLGNKSFVLVWE